MSNHPTSQPNFSGVKGFPGKLFFLLAFIPAWILWIGAALTGLEVLRIIGTFAPTIAGLVLIPREQGREGLLGLKKRLLRWRVNPGWYLFALTSTWILGLVGIWVYRLIGGQAVLEYQDPSQWYMIFPVFFYVLFLSVLGEEIGWRGYALPKLQRRFNPLRASIILGIIWSLWHAPLWFIPGNFHVEISPLLFLLQSVALSVIYTWMFNSTGGSLLLVHIFHAASNVTIGLLPILPGAAEGQQLPLLLVVTLGVFLATGVAILTRGRLGYPLLAGD